MTGKPMMQSAEVAAAGMSRSDAQWHGARLYWALLAAQLVGVALLLENMIPLYRVMATDFPNFTPHERPWWAVAGMLLIQATYWSGVRLHPPLPRKRSLVIGHIVAFVARMGFVAVTAAFTVMFLNRYEALKSMSYPPLRALGALMIFFTLFCTTLELERLAKALQENKSRKERMRSDGEHTHAHFPSHLETGE